MSTGTRERLDRYAAAHRHPVDLALHCVCIPLVAWAVIAGLWTVPPPAPQWFRPGLWAVGAMFAAYGFYHRISRPLAYAMALALIAGGALAMLLYNALGPRPLRGVALALFAAGWVGLAVGHLLEQRPGAVLEDATQFLLGPAWLMEKLLQRLGIAHRD